MFFDIGCSPAEIQIFWPDQKSSFRTEIGLQQRVHVAVAMHIRRP